MSQEGRRVKKWPAFSPDSKNCVGFLFPIGGVGGGHQLWRTGRGAIAGCHLYN